MEQANAQRLDPRHQSAVPRDPHNVPKQALRIGREAARVLAQFCWLATELHPKKLNQAPPQYVSITHIKIRIETNYVLDLPIPHQSGHPTQRSCRTRHPGRLGQVVVRSARDHINKETHPLKGLGRGTVPGPPPGKTLDDSMVHGRMIPREPFVHIAGLSLVVDLFRISLTVQFQQVLRLCNIFQATSRCSPHCNLFFCQGLVFFTHLSSHMSRFSFSRLVLVQVTI
jgi:hypothetical protein